MTNSSTRVCPAERAGMLEFRLRRWLQSPAKIVGPWVREGMTVLDLGCGPGFFSIEMARLVGRSGRVLACDLQVGMLERLGDKIRGTDLEERVVLHRCEEGRIGAPGPVDFVLAFYVLHEIPDQGAIFRELRSILQPGGRILLVEPPVHVSRKAFAETLGWALAAGFVLVERPRVSFSKTALLRTE